MTSRRANMSRDGIRHFEALELIASTCRRVGSRAFRDYEPDVVNTIGELRQAQCLSPGLG